MAKKKPTAKEMEKVINLVINSKKKEGKDNESI